MNVHLSLSVSLSLFADFSFPTRNGIPLQPKPLVSGFQHRMRVRIMRPTNIEYRARLVFSGECRVSTMHPPPPQPRLCNKGCRIERTPQIRVQRASRKLRTRHQILGIKLSFRVRSLLLLVFFLLFKSYCSSSISSRIVVTFLRFPFPVSMIFLSIHLSTCVFWHPRLHLIWYFAWSCPFRFPVVLRGTVHGGRKERGEVKLTRITRWWRN